MNGIIKQRWCKDWKPPPFPWDVIPEQCIPKEWNITELKSLVFNNEGFKLYANECDIEIPSTRADTIPTSTTTQAPVPHQQEAQTAGGGIIAAIVISVLVIILVVIVVLWILWKKKKKRSASINSLPLKKYEDTNFLDNKARQNQCYNIASTDLNHDDKNANNQYGSFTQAKVETTNADYINAKSRNSREINVESPVEFDKMNSSGLSGSCEKTGYENDNFMNDLDETGTRSPGAGSQTPLFDEIDGTALPNSVPSSKTLSENGIHGSDKPQSNGSLKAVSSGRLPPIDMTVNKTYTRKNSDRKNSSSSRKRSDTSLRSPKKKKPGYLQRKSEPVEGLEDITQDMAGNRKSV